MSLNLEGYIIISTGLNVYLQVQANNKCRVSDKVSFNHIEDMHLFI